MYKLAEVMRVMFGDKLSDKIDIDIYCKETDKDITFRVNRLQDTLACYSFTLVTEGWLIILYNGQELTLHKHDIYTYSPGFPVSIIAASADYHGICLLADEIFTLESSTMRNAIRAAYFPIVEMSEPKLSLSPDDAAHLQELMQLAIRYLNSKHPFREESLRILYNLFLLDLTAAQERAITQHRFPQRVEEIFLDFLRLLPQHFVEHHDIGFYADQLHITTTYLSRIVRKVTGRTVIAYVNQLLIMEATWLLQSTTLSIAQIADCLHFSETASFVRFFSRMKGVTPQRFRTKS